MSKKTNKTQKNHWVGLLKKRFLTLQTGKTCNAACYDGCKKK